VPVGYHAIPHGWLTGELVRQVSGDTIGPFFSARSRGPIGIAPPSGTSPAGPDPASHDDRTHRRRGPTPPRPLRLPGHKLMRDPRTLTGKAFSATARARAWQRRTMSRRRRSSTRRCRAQTGRPGATPSPRVACIARDGARRDARLERQNVARYSKTAISLPDELMLEAAPAVAAAEDVVPGRAHARYLVNPKNPGTAGPVRAGPPRVRPRRCGRADRVRRSRGEENLRRFVPPTRLTASTTPRCSSSTPPIAAPPADATQVSQS